MTSPDSPAPDFVYLQLIASYAPSWGYGGPVRLMYDYARWMAALTSSEVYSGNRHHDNSSLPADEQIMEGIVVRRYPTWVLQGRLHCPHPRLLRDLIRRLRDESRRAVLHICELRGAIPVYALLAKTYAPEKVTLLFSPFGHLHEKRSWFRRGYDSLLLRRFLKSVDLALVQNEHEEESYRELLNVVGIPAEHKKTLRLPLHLDRDRINQTMPLTAPAGAKNPARVQALRSQYQVPENALVLIFLGRLHSSKGIGRVIDVFQRLVLAGNNDIYLLIVGRDDGDQANLQVQISAMKLEHRIRIVNNVYAERFAYYYLADIFVGFPVIHEETMLASVEALFCATPVLVSREADIPFVEEKRAGFIIGYTPEAAVAAFHLIIQSLPAFQANAVMVAQKYFDAHVIRQRLITAVFGSV